MTSQYMHVTFFIIIYRYVGGKMKAMSNRIGEFSKILRISTFLPLDSSFTDMSSTFDRININLFFSILVKSAMMSTGFIMISRY